MAEEEKLKDMLNIVAQQRDNAMNTVVQVSAELTAANRKIAELESPGLKKKPSRDGSHIEVK